ncbi:MAG: PAS domain-containing sensor histidine kinase [Saprospiraceae bacterium]
MSLRVKYFLFVSIIHIIIAYLCFLLLRDQKLYFLLSEFGILFSLFLSYLMYRSFIRPLDFMYSGTDAIQDKDFTIKFVKTGSKEMDRLIDVYNNMIDNIREERIQVEEQHFFLKKLISASPNGIIILDYDEKITDINPRAMKLLELNESAIQQPISNFPNPILQQITRLEIGKANIISSEGFEKYKCEVSHFIHRGFKRKFILIQELSKEILEAEKRAYGKIIRMMAHEVNNSIGAINSILQTHVEYNTEENSDERESLEIAIERNNSMSSFMKNFAKVVRLPKPHLEKIELNELLQNISKLMESQARTKNITIELHLHKNNIFTSIDSKQMEQVLVNIIKNAIESIENQGVIQIISQASPATILVRDNGAGISAEVANNLFTPFFSTKTDGQGVGLTLIREVLLNHDAQFSLKTNEDAWTEFRIIFNS